MKKKKKLYYRDDLLERLRNPERAVVFLNAALEDEDKNVFLLALRDLAEAHGMAKVAGLTCISREHIYRLLSEKGNPEFVTLKNLLNAIGFRLAIETKTHRKKAA